MEENNHNTGPVRRRFRKRWIAWALLAIWGAVAAWNVTKPMPAGTNVHSGPVAVDAASIRFLADLTYHEPRGELVYEQQIFDEVFRMVDSAESFIVGRPPSRRGIGSPCGSNSGYPRARSMRSSSSSDT